MSQIFFLNALKILLLLFYFYLLGSTAERFFCPVLGRISRALNLSPNVAV
jgi:Ca2+/Na+ antiporter